MLALVLGSVVGLAAVVLTTRHLRGAAFARFVAVILGLHTTSLLGVAAAIGEYFVVFAALQLATCLHFLTFLRPRLGSLPWRLAISWPASFAVGGSFLAVPWAAMGAFGAHPPAAWVPFAIAGIGLVQSLLAREEELDVVLDGAELEGPDVVRHRAPVGELCERPLRIVQITDPHLGSFMSEERLARICQRAVDREPDLVLLTGDYLTIESQHEPGPLTRALAPLRALPGRVFACRGNHDHEAPDVVAEALAANGVRLLVDEESVVTTAAGPVQILGVDFAWTRRRERMATLCARHPRRPGHLRLLLLHHPGAFRELPRGEADLVLSGHTHGGHVGLVSLGLPTTIVSAVAKMPDHGLWARGRDRLYVHRGTGHYGFPLRLGVPAEQSLLRVHFQSGHASEARDGLVASA